ncbi:MAG: maleylpyruvate isomerase family mycothiol-dependent enzyme [Candidatus Rokuibacteriota bacterium]
MSAIDPRRSLALLKPEQELLNECISRLTPEELVRPSNLAHWSVADVAVHITRVCDSINLAVQRATVSDRTPAFGEAARPREAEIRTKGPQGWAEHGRECCRRITEIVAGLTDEQLGRYTFPHPLGERSVRWFCTQLLTEVGFHRWDLGYSLGQRGPLSEELGAYVLPFMLDRDEPVFAARRTQVGQEIYTLVSDAGSWKLTVTPDGTISEFVTRPEGSVISATPGWLCVAMYGRVRVDQPAFTVIGPAEAAARFAAIFGPGG